MDYNILVNKDNPLPRAHIPNTLVDAESEYKKNVYIDKKVKESFDRLKEAAKRNNYLIDIESGYRDYDYQEKLYNKLLDEKGFMEAQDSVIEGGNIARVAREQLERKTGKKVVSDKNAKEIRKLNSGKE